MLTGLSFVFYCNVLSSDINHFSTVLNRSVMIG